MKNLIFITLLIITLVSGCKTQSAMTGNSTSDTQNREAIQAFYGKALTVNSETRPTAILTPLFAEGYKSSNSTDSKSAQKLMGQLEFFWKVIPDLKWTPQDITTDGETYTVRSVASGTPNGNFMGVPTDGTKSFNMMTIDVHKMKDGKFLSTHHVEDWTTAMKQLKPVDQSDATMKVAMGFMEAMTKGQMEKMKGFMHEDMVWQNGGDKSLPWIGIWKSKRVILEKFLPAFGANFQTIKWESDDAFSSDDTGAFFGQMQGQLTQSKKKTDEFSWALRVKVKDEKVILWNWFEDSYEVSKAYHNR